jgi:hypothetical protein
VGRIPGRSFWSILLALALLTGTSPVLQAQSQGVETAGDVLQILIPASGFAATYIKDDPKGRTQFLKSFLLNFGTTVALKRIVGRERPDGSDHRSFPSGHTSAAFQGASFLHLRYGWVYGIAGYGGATFVAFSRVHAERHHVGDVLVGAGVGFFSSLLFTERFDGLQANASYEYGRLGFQARLMVGR